MGAHMYPNYIFLFYTFDAANEGLVVVLVCAVLFKKKKDTLTQKLTSQLCTNINL